MQQGIFRAASLPAKYYLPLLGERREKKESAGDKNSSPIGVKCLDTFESDEGEGGGGAAVE